MPQYADVFKNFKHLHRSLIHVGKLLFDKEITG